MGWVADCTRTGFKTATGRLKPDTTDGLKLSNQHSNVVTIRNDAARPT
jgi:hypothetical protein